ncbi:DEAD/DEAH box helicase [Methanococcoides seepicolus]|uniref:DEAD/DEAH box helicase n=2 Tax=Methanococcoides TaxID=2225 RepID=A0A9E5DAJ7_9EURY|nr:DEAD/DEAH box helicase [Methanococcoides seepicolus]MCM1986171.1 DEAD/DEAH box helicase [Methanococcoides seepicolus]
MTLWTFLKAEKAKVIVMAIKDRKRVPLLTGELILRTSPAGPRPHKFRVVKDDKEELRQPEEFIELLRISERILIDIESEKRSEAAVRELLDDFHLESEDVHVCRFCLLKKQFNFINKKSIKYHHELICEDCAKEELEMALRNAHRYIGDEAADRILQIMLTTRDLDRTIGMLSPEELDLEYTRFDTIEQQTHANKIKIKDVPLSKKLKDILLQKSDTFLPVQSLSIEKGLLERRNQLVTSVTATGKTLIGEIAGIENILHGHGKMLYLVPLVALANQKYDQFNKRYSGIGLNTSIRVGSSKIRTSKTKKMKRGLDADIIVGTYEGLDVILRTGDADLLGQIGTVVIDEVHMIEDSERGHRLDGVIGRLKYVASGAQFIYLSATVAKPKLLAKRLNTELVEYEYRPVPIERHLLFCPESSKIRLMTKLAKDEYAKVSSKGHRGQTIIFTNSRRNCHSIAQAISIPASPYHAGLSMEERKKIERRFEKGDIPVVVTTAALAAGVDFPASQVIFESLAMGIEWLNMQEFLQMLGRAGRPDFHDRGIVVLLATPQKHYTSEQTGTEEEVAIRLLNGEMEHTDVKYGEEEQIEEILATAAVTTSKRDLETIHRNMLADFAFSSLLAKLKKKKFITIKDDSIALTKFGSIAAGHFLSISKAFLIRDAVLSDHRAIEIVTNLEFFEAVYFKYAAQISTALKINMPSRVFQGASMDIVMEGENLSKLETKMQDQILDFAADFLTCGCKDSPFCGCPEHLFSEKIINMRMDGYDPIQIVRQLEDKYGITAYPGDLLGYLDDTIRNLDAVERIAAVYSKKDIAHSAKDLKKLIEG